MSLSLVGIVSDSKDCKKNNKDNKVWKKRMKKNNLKTILFIRKISLCPTCIGK